MPSSSRVPDHVASQHPVDREVLADVPQEIEHWHGPCPVKVVDDPCGVLPREVDKTLDLPANAFDPGGHCLFGVEDPLAGLFRITDQSGRSADQNQGAVPGTLQGPGHHELHKVAEVQTRRRWIKADIESDRPSRQVLGQRRFIGGEGYQATPLQIAEHRRSTGQRHSSVGLSMREVDHPSPGVSANGV